MSTLVALGPILAGFTADYILRRTGLAAMKDGGFLLLPRLQRVTHGAGELVIRPPIVR